MCTIFTAVDCQKSFYVMVKYESVRRTLYPGSYVVCYTRYTVLVYTGTTSYTWYVVYVVVVPVLLYWYTGIMLVYQYTVLVYRIK